jgi:hypothetical protein
MLVCLIFSLKVSGCGLEVHVVEQQLSCRPLDYNFCWQPVPHLLRHVCSRLFLDDGAPGPLVIHLVQPSGLHPVIRQQTSTHELELLWSRVLCAGWCDGQSFLRPPPLACFASFLVGEPKTFPRVVRWRLPSATGLPVVFAVVSESAMVKERSKKEKRLPKRRVERCSEDGSSTKGKVKKAQKCLRGGRQSLW